MSIKSSLRAAVVLGALVYSLWLNVALAQQVGFTWSPRPRPYQFMAPGFIVSGLNATTLDGERAALTFNDRQRETVLYFLSPHCPWSALNVESINALASQGGNQFEVVGLIADTEVDAMNTLPAAQRPTFPVYALDAAAREKYRLGTTPSTFVVTKAGMVERGWPGAYNGDRQAEIESYFGVALPKLEIPQRPSDGTTSAAALVEQAK
ncbi:MAG: peroxiredoxin family protein [Vicinamibacterales bacterium]